MSPHPDFPAFPGERDEILGDTPGQDPNPVAEALKAVVEDLFQLVRSSCGFSASKVDSSQQDGGKCPLTLGWYSRSPQSWLG